MTLKDVKSDGTTTVIYPFRIPKDKDPDKNSVQEKPRSDGTSPVRLNYLTGEIEFVDSKEQVKQPG